MTNSINQLRMNMLDLNSQLLNKSSNNISKLTETVEVKEENFVNKDIINYDEYIKYCEENAVSQYSVNPCKTIFTKVTDTSAQVQSIRPINIGKAITAYSQSEHSPLEAAVESEA